MFIPVVLGTLAFERRRTSTHSPSGRQRLCCNTSVSLESLTEVAWECRPRRNIVTETCCTRFILKCISLFRSTGGTIPPKSSYFASYLIVRQLVTLCVWLVLLVLLLNLVLKHFLYSGLLSVEAGLLLTVLRYFLLNFVLWFCVTDFLSLNSGLLFVVVSCLFSFDFLKSAYMGARRNGRLRWFCA